MQDLGSVPRDGEVAPVLPPVSGGPESWSFDQREAVRLSCLRTVKDVESTIAEGLAVLSTAKRDCDYQLFIAGLRKLLVGGLSAKVLADSMLEAYGPDWLGSL